jgi:integrase
MSPRKTVIRGMKPLGKGRYQSELVLPGTNLRRRRKFKAADMKAAVKAHLTWRDEVLELGGNRGDWTLRAYAKRFDAALTGRLEPSSVVSFKSDLARLLPAIGERKLSAVNAAVVRDAVAVLQRDEYAADTINRTLATLRKILHDAVDRGELMRYPVRGKLPMQRMAKLQLELTDEERNAFLAAFDDPVRFTRDLSREHVSSYLRPRPGAEGRTTEGIRAEILYSLFRWDRPLFVVALETGLSRCDLLGLRWAQVDSEAGLIRTERRKTGVGATIPVSWACSASLEEVRSRHFVTPLVFTMEDGSPVGLTRLHRHFERAKSIAGITRRLRFHDLRHTFASRLASKMVSLQVIAKTLGHASTRMSERYARPDNDAVRKAADALNENGSHSQTNSVKPKEGTK